MYNSVTFFSDIYVVTSMLQLKSLNIETLLKPLLYQDRHRDLFSFIEKRSFVFF